MPRALLMAATLAIAVLMMLTASPARAAEGDPPPAPNPNDPVVRVQNLTTMLVTGVENATDDVVARLGQMIGMPEKSIRLEARKGVQRLAELGRRGNRAFESLARVLKRELKQKKASEAQARAVTDALKAGRDALKNAVADGTKAIKDKAAAVLEGNVGQPGPPVSSP